MRTEGRGRSAGDGRAGSASELLGRHGSEHADRIARCFAWTPGARIVRAEIHAVGLEATRARYSGQEAERFTVFNILRLRTADGCEAVSGVDSYSEGGFSDEHLHELEQAVAALLSISSLDPVVAGRRIATQCPTLSDTVRASIDIALWDLAARKTDRPLCALFGASRRSLGAYASLPFIDSPDGCVTAVRERAASGYSAFKLHGWGLLERDLELVAVIREAFADSGLHFMLDAECVYDLCDALTLGIEMERGPFVAFEAPIEETRLQEFAELRRNLSLRIIPDGCEHYSPEFMRDAIEADAWDAMRFDTTLIGGVSKALELVSIANEAELPVDVQSWGHSLAQAVNLHEMLAAERSSSFEVPTPEDAYSFGTRGRLLGGGRAMMPAQAGLGLAVDWEALPDADFHVVR